MQAIVRREVIVPGARLIACWVAIEFIKNINKSIIYIF
jgi:hypothetical protein